MNGWTRAILPWFPVPGLQTPHLLGHRPFLPWQSGDCLSHSQGYSSELLSLSHPKPCFFYYQKMTQPLISHMSVNSHIKVLFLQCLYLAFPFQLFQRKRHLPSFPVDTRICASSRPVLCGVEQTASGSDLDLSPSSNILQLFPASLLPEYGNYIVAAAAKSLQSCPTLCDPVDGSLPGSPVPGILQARKLEWVAISFSSVWKWKVTVKSLSHVWLLATPWTAAYQSPPSVGLSRREYWSGVPLPISNCKFHSLLLWSNYLACASHWVCTSSHLCLVPQTTSSSFPCWVSLDMSPLSEVSLAILHLEKFLPSFKILFK